MGVGTAVAYRGVATLHGYSGFLDLSEPQTVWVSGCCGAYGFANKKKYIEIQQCT